MGSSESKASEKSDALETSILAKQNDKSPTKQSVKTSVEESSARRRSKSAFNRDVQNEDWDYGTAPAINVDQPSRQNTYNAQPVGNAVQSRAPRHQRPAAGNDEESSSGDDNNQVDEQAYQDMLNEAIIQSLLDQDRLADEKAKLELPDAQQEENMLKEVLKMSSLEYQKQTGKLNLNALKRKNRKPSPEVQNQKTLTKEQKELAELTKMTAPKQLAPVQFGKKNPLDQIKAMTASRINLDEHQQSTATMVGMQSMKTNDKTTVQIDPSQARLRQEIDEDSILREIGSLAPLKAPFDNKRNTHVRARAQAEDFMNSGDFDVSISQSPGKLDRHLEKIVAEHQRKTQEEDFEDLMSNIERESAQVTIDANNFENKSTASPFKPSPSIRKHSKMFNRDDESGFGTDKDLRLKMTDMHSNLYSRQSGNVDATIANSTRGGAIPTEMGNEDLNSHFDFMKESNEMLSDKKQKKLLNQRSDLEDEFNTVEQPVQSPIKVIANSNPNTEMNSAMEKKTLERKDSIDDLDDFF